MTDKLKIIKLPKVMEMTTFCRTTIYRLIEKGKFPKQIKLAERSSGWLESEVLDYLEAKINNRHIETHPNTGEARGVTHDV
jgi:prophage regulatory protein